MSRIVFGVLLVLVTSPLLAQDDLDAKVKKFFERFDANKDGVVSSEEYTDAETFKRLDINRDGKITAADFKPYDSQPAKPDAGAELMKRFDANKDGKISRGELEAAPQLFARLDSDANGELSKDEAAKASAADVAKIKTGGSQAPEMGDRPKRRGGMGMLDTDGDGKVSKKEFLAMQAKNFDRMDANKDGALDAEELKRSPMAQAMRGKRGGGDQNNEQALTRAKMMIKRVDKDGDGAISKEEAPERMAQMFDRADKNGDGKITAEELVAAFGARGGKKRRPQGGDKPGEKKGDANKPGDAPDAEQRVKMILQRFDKNGDGELTGDEAPERLMNALDKNGDGKVTAEELKAMPQRRKQR